MTGRQQTNTKNGPDSVAQQALAFLVYKDILGVECPNHDFPQELQGSKPVLQKILRTFKEELLATCHKLQSPLESPSLDPKPYKCPHCEPPPKRYESKNYDDWKKHLLGKHETRHEREWRLGPNRRFKFESQFHEHHKKDCLECQKWDIRSCSGRKRRKSCKCCRCQHANKALVTMKVWHACGFCSDNQVFNRWDDYCSHLREHLERGTPISSWSHSRVIYALICRDATLDKAFAEVEGASVLDWGKEAAEKLRQYLQLYNDGDDASKLVGKIYKRAKQQEDTGSLSVPGTPSSPTPDDHDESVTPHSTSQTLKRARSVMSEDTNENSSGSPFMGALDDTAYAEENLGPPAKLPRLNGNLSPSDGANLPSTNITTPPPNTTNTDYGESVTQEPSNCLMSESDIYYSEDPEWGAIVGDSPTLCAALEEAIGAKESNQILEVYYKIG